MELLSAIILGFVEGATEFIPVSSSGHLIIVRQLLGVESGGLSFDAVLQLSTSLSIIIYFKKDIWKLIVNFFKLILGKFVSSDDKKLLYSIVLGTIPAVVLGLFLENIMDTIFRSVTLVSLALIIGSLLFVFAENRFKKNQSRNLEEKDVTVKRGVVIGFFQALALIPGISRSGSTISGGLIMGLSREEATRFSFLLSLPVLLGAGLKKFFDLRETIFTTDLGLSLLIGSAVAFITGLLAINFLVKYLRNHSLNVFVWYRIALAILLILLF